MYNSYIKNEWKNSWKWNSRCFKANNNYKINQKLNWTSCSISSKVFIFVVYSLKKIIKLYCKVNGVEYQEYGYINEDIKVMAYDFELFVKETIAKNVTVKINK